MGRIAQYRTISELERRIEGGSYVAEMISHIRPYLPEGGRYEDIRDIQVSEYWGEELMSYNHKGVVYFAEIDIESARRTTGWMIIEVNGEYIDPPRPV